MANLSTARDRFNSANSLLCLLQALEGQVTVVELRDESSVKGKIEQVDGFMNVTMSDATVEANDGEFYRFDSFFVKARNIRYVQIPVNVNITEAIEHQLQGRRIKPQVDPNSTKAKLARKRQRETLKLIQAQLQSKNDKAAEDDPGPSTST